YPIFIKCLRTNKIKCSIEKWLTTHGNLIISDQHSSNSIQNTDLSHSHSNIIQIITKLIYKSFFLIFIEYEANLHTFEVTMITLKECEYFNNAFELILQNPNFIRNIKNLAIDFDLKIENISNLLIFLNSNCNSISL